MMRPDFHRASLLGALFLWSGVAWAEGAAQVGANQNFQAATNLTLGNKTLRVGRLGADIFDVAENITWTGNGTLDVWPPSADPDTDSPTVLASGSTFDTTETGTHYMEANSNQGNTAWNIVVTGTASGYGRVFSEAWHFLTGGYDSGRSTNASFYALVPAGDSSRTGVIELKLDGMSGYQYVISANQTGVDGAIAGRSVPVSGNGFTPQYRIYLNPPEIATYNPLTPNVSVLDFKNGALDCNTIATGANAGSFEFSTDVEGTYHLVCDLNDDSVYNRVGSEDFLYVGLATPGVNTATWNGLDNGGNPVADGTYDCQVYVNTGEMHYVAWDIETADQGLRMFEVASDLSRFGLNGFWNDTAVQSGAVTMLSGEVGAETSGALGINAGDFIDAAVAQTSVTNGNAHGWGNYNNSGNSKGDDTLIDTFAFLRSQATGTVSVKTVDPSQDSDGDNLPDYDESCEIGTDPDDPDTDGDGIPDDEETNGGTPVDSDGDGIIDPLDADSDNDGTPDAIEGGVDTDSDGIPDALDLDSDGDGIPDTIEQQLGALDTDGDGRLDDDTDTDDDGLADSVDDDPDDPAVITTTYSPVNTDGLPDGDDRVDLDSDEDGLSDVLEGGGTDTDLDDLQDPTADANSNGLDDAIEPGGADGPLPIPNTDATGNPDFQDNDADDDGVQDGSDTNPTNSTICSDTDGDSCEDCLSGSYDPGNDGADNDLDGTCNLTDPDDDNDGALDASDSDDNNPLICSDNEPDTCDDCSSGTFAPGNDGPDFDGDGLCDAGDPDDDNDGAPDDQDDTDDDPSSCSDSDGDSCEDCLSGTFDPSADGADFDGDGLCDAGDPDDDNDGSPDTEDSDDNDPNVCTDDDADFCDDCSSGTKDTDADGTDSDSDGLCDLGEIADGSDPDDADSDDDGVPDNQEPDRATDTDGDGLINSLDPDSDNDGLPDGTEMGFACDDAATDVTRGLCTPDADDGLTTTDPLNADTDGGGASDGSEDANLDGAVDPGETNPTSGQDADDSGVTDTDGDGLSDAVETFLGSDPNDADSDDDGLLDGDEPNPSLDMDGDGLIDLLDVDSDNDGLFDGTEVGNDCQNAATNLALGHCRADADSASTTSPLDADSDDGGMTDGSEDSNLDGAVDSGETDPTLGNDADDSTVVDTDADGLSDDLETFLGSDPDDADSDDDGLPDGEEPNPSDDQDGDTLINVLDSDSDDDGLFDGTEVGNDCLDPDIDQSMAQCIADADGGTTTTSPLDADTDDGGVPDGEEDTNHDGAIDAGEWDPNDPTDDPACQMDSECGDADSGRICEGYQCVDGCRGADGNLCPSGEMCSSTDSSAGTCEPIEPTPECGEDADCGDAQSGRICEAESCVDGCRGQNGNGCPSDKMCTSTDSSVGECRPIKEPPEGTGGMGTGGMAPETGGAPASGGTDPATGGTPETTDDDLQPIARGGGIYCSTQLLPGGVPSWPAGLLLFAATLGVVRRRKRGERAA